METVYSTGKGFPVVLEMCSHKNNGDSTTLTFRNFTIRGQISNSKRMMIDEIYVDPVDDTRLRRVKQRKGTTWIVDLHSDSEETDENDENVSDEVNESSDFDED